MPYEFTILNDCHIGASRTAGTTQASALALRKYGLKKLQEVLDKIQTDIVVNGDMFDGFMIPLADALETRTALLAWRERTGKCLTLLPGNHDLASDSSKLSAFEHMAMTMVDDPGVRYFRQGAMIYPGVYAIPHVHNQDLFDYELSKVPECDYLLLHCNYNNGFAKESDHSLNLSLEAIKACKARKVILGHEHSPAVHQDGRVEIAGVQWPTSISDCLDRQDKGMLRVTPEGVYRENTWSRSEYCEVNWKELFTVPDEAKFVRVIGKASDDEAAAAVDAIAKLRKTHSAFVISSAVLIGETTAELDVSEAMNSIEQLQAFDVVQALYAMLQPGQVSLLKNLK